MEHPEQADLYIEKVDQWLFRIGREGGEYREWLLMDNWVSFGGDENILKLERWLHNSVYMKKNHWMYRLRIPHIIESQLPFGCLFYLCLDWKKINTDAHLRILKAI